MLFCKLCHSVVVYIYHTADMTHKYNYNSHSLVKIPTSEWKYLLQLYAQKKTESGGYFLIENYIRWLDKDPTIDVNFFCLDNNWQSDGTFIAIVNNGSQYKEVWFNTLDDNLERLTKALLCLLASSEDVELCGYPKRLAPAADAYLKNFSNIRTGDTYWYTVSKDVVANYSTEPPAGITLRSLNIADASTISAIWPHRCAGSENMVKGLIEHNVSVGACDEKGNLIAWCLILPLGALGLLQVLDTHKRLGLGSLLVRCMSKKTAELGAEVLASVVTVNTPSIRMFEKLGFKQIDETFWAWIDAK